MVYTSALQAPPRYQWDKDSRLPAMYPGSGNGPVNCGPSCVTFIAGFYKDLWFGITDTRRLGGVPDYTATSILDQERMLEARGVKCYWSQPSLSTMKSLISSGRRPIVVGLYMARVPDSIKDHPFDGMHAVVLQANANVSGQSGVYVMDPNFNPLDGRYDPDKGRKFYPDWVIDTAFFESTTGGRSYALIPNNAKLVTVPDTSTPTPVPQEFDVNPLNFTVPADTGRLFDVKAGTTLYNDEAMRKPRTTLKDAAEMRLIALHRTNGSAFASNPGNPGGSPFIVPKNH